MTTSVKFNTSSFITYLIVCKRCPQAHQKDRNESTSFPSRCVVQARCPDTDNWITAILRSGYYEGACWDWQFENEDESVSDATIDAVEELFARVSTKLSRIGTFSNGETIYKQST